MATWSWAIGDLQLFHFFKTDSISPKVANLFGNQDSTTSYDFFSAKFLTVIHKNLIKIVSFFLQLDYQDTSSKFLSKFPTECIAFSFQRGGIAAIIVLAFSHSKILLQKCWSAFFAPKILLQRCWPAFSAPKIPSKKLCFEKFWSKFLNPNFRSRKFRTKFFTSNFWSKKCWSAFLKQNFRSRKC